MSFYPRSVNATDVKIDHQVQELAPEYTQTEQNRIIKNNKRCRD